uniref:Callose synthase 10-like n=1 Tax=Nicotiana tabacum TaxID=4097 RepID=A0A1S3Y5X4_TOBAC|nr:PREDICTED: callose synthase 10-like [Nicotiana tabacum]
MSDQSFFQFFKWIYQERYFVGRGLVEKTTDYLRYLLYWLVIFACKFTFAYFLQIKPLVGPTQIILDLPSLQYSWHDFISKSKSTFLIGFHVVQNLTPFRIVIYHHSRLHFW